MEKTRVNYRGVLFINSEMQRNVTVVRRARDRVTGRLLCICQDTYGEEYHVFPKQIKPLPMAASQEQ